MVVAGKSTAQGEGVATAAATADYFRLQTLIGAGFRFRYGKPIVPLERTFLKAIRRWKTAAPQCPAKIIKWSIKPPQTEECHD